MFSIIEHKAFTYDMIGLGFIEKLDHGVHSKRQVDEGVFYKKRDAALRMNATKSVK